MTISMLTVLQWVGRAVEFLALAFFGYGFGVGSWIVIRKYNRGVWKSRDYRLWIVSGCLMCIVVGILLVDFGLVRLTW